MAIFETTEYDALDNPIRFDPLSVPNDLAASIKGEKERWIAVAFEGPHTDLMSAAKAAYVEATDKWLANREDHELNQE